MKTWLLLVAFVVGCSPATDRAAPPAPARIVSRPHVTQSPGARCHYNASGELPDPRCTPGAYDPAFTVAQACGGQNQTRRNVTAATKTRVAAAYGVTRDQYQEADHLVMLALGGTNDARNIWPEPKKAAKDAVEARTLAAVCHGRMTLLEAQTAFAHDWRTLR